MKPQDFLVGIRDFFSVVVPGAIFLLCIPSALLPKGPQDATLSLFAAAIAAYLIGALASVVGSLLDKPVDPALESDFVKHRWKRLGDRAALASEMQDRVLERLAPAERAKYKESLKSFWWGHLRLRCPEAIAELDRIEAVQKLCRSLVPLFAVLAGWSAAAGARWSGAPLSPGQFAAAAGLALILYIGGRAEFLASVYRYGAAYVIAREEGSAPGAHAK